MIGPKPNETRQTDKGAGWCLEMNLSNSFASTVDKGYAAKKDRRCAMIVSRKRWPKAMAMFSVTMNDKSDLVILNTPVTGHSY